MRGLCLDRTGARGRTERSSGRMSDPPLGGEDETKKPCGRAFLWPLLLSQGWRRRRNAPTSPMTPRPLGLIVDLQAQAARQWSISTTFSELMLHTGRVYNYPAIVFDR